MCHILKHWGPLSDISPDAWFQHNRFIQYKLTVYWCVSPVLWSLIHFASLLEFEHMFLIIDVCSTVNVYDALFCCAWICDWSNNTTKHLLNTVWVPGASRASAPGLSSLICIWDSEMLLILSSSQQSFKGLKVCQILSLRFLNLTHHLCFGGRNFSQTSSCWLL